MVLPHTDFGALGVTLQIAAVIAFADETIWLETTLLVERSCEIWVQFFPTSWSGKYSEPEITYLLAKSMNGYEDPNCENTLV